VGSGLRPTLYEGRMGDEEEEVEEGCDVFILPFARKEVAWKRNVRGCAVERMR
jgi:hypothetical protein